MGHIRQPAVAGTFYPAGQQELQAMLDAMLAAADASGPAPKAMIVPHAGYSYSGPVAASGYIRLRQAASSIDRVVLMGPAHRVPVRGLALPDADAFNTPLGMIPLDVEVMRSLRAQPQVHVDATAHQLEHSLEVHLPFLQTVLDNFTLVPLVVGDASADEVCAVIEQVWDGPETLLVISSDLSHFHDYQTAQRLDAATARAIETLALEDVGYDHACGRAPVSGLLLYARQHGLSLKTIDLRNSGDTAGPRSQVVGYGTFVLAD